MSGGKTFLDRLTAFMGQVVQDRLATLAASNGELARLLGETLREDFQYFRVYELVAALTQDMDFATKVQDALRAEIRVARGAVTSV